MPIKKTTAVALLLAALCPALANAQWRQTGGFFSLGTEAILSLTGDLVSNGSNISNNGQIFCNNLASDPGSTLSGAGIWNLSGSLNNADGAISNTDGEFWLIGSASAQINAGNAELYKLRLAKSGNGTQVSLAAPLKVASELRFAAANNKLLLGNFDFTLGAAGTVAGASEAKFVVTTGAGRFVKKSVGSTAFAFPIGATPSTYNKMTVKNTGTLDDIGVRCLPNVLSGGSSGTPILTDAVKTSWEISEQTPGGSNLTLTASWYVGDEMTGFDRTNCAVRWNNGSSWVASPNAAASGTGPYTRQRSNISTLGYFAVFDGTLLKPSADERAEQIADNQRFESSENALSVFPNPTADWLRLRLKNASEPLAEIRLVDGNGRTVALVHRPAADERLDVAALPDGIYRALARTERGQLWTASFVKIK